MNALLPIGTDFLEVVSPDRPGTATIRFVPAGPRGEGVDGVDLLATYRPASGTEQTLCGTLFRLV